MCSNLCGRARPLCERTQRSKQGRRFDEAGGQIPLQGVQRCWHVLILKNRRKQLTKDLQDKRKPER